MANIKINRKMLPLNSLRAFEATGIHLSFTKAGDRLNVTQSAVSRHVLNLEDILGTKLFLRNHHNLTLTRQGEALLVAVTKAFDGLERQLSEFAGEEGQASLRIALPPTFAYCRVIPALKEFKTEYPNIDIEIQCPRSAPDLIKDRFDLTVIYSPGEVNDYQTSLLWHEEMTVLCHPKLLQAYPADPKQMLTTNLLIHNKLGDNGNLTWENWFNENGMVLKNDARELVFDTAILAAQYAMSGQGLVLTDLTMFQSEIDAGKLYAPFDLKVKSGYGYYLVQKRQENAAAVQLFANWIMRRFGI